MNSLRDPLEVLRSLDPAPVTADPHAPRARADLARIVGTRRGAGSPAPRRRSTVRLAVAAAAVLAVGSALVVLPSLTGSDSAYATWTGDPQAVTTGDRAELADACRDSQREGAGAGQSQALASATAAVAERRGAWTLVLLTGDDGFSAMCITDESRPLFRSSIGYVGVRAETAEPADQIVRIDALGVGSIDGHELSVAAGPVPAEVVALTYSSAAHGEVSATVSQGQFAFWLPGDELEDASREGAPVEVTYEDGTVESRTLVLG